MFTMTHHERVLHIHLESGLNTLRFDFTSKLAKALHQADQREDISVIVISGNEKAFSVGAALDEMVDLSPDDVDVWLAPWESIAYLQKPILMALHGYVLGGGLEIAMMGDMLFATPHTVFGQPEIKLALLPGCGGTLRLMQAIGYHKAFEMIVSGDTIQGEEAYHFGLINALFTSEHLITQTLQRAHRIAEHSPTALKDIKKLMRKGFDDAPPFKQWLDEERHLFKNLLVRSDAKENIQNFLSGKSKKY